MKKVLCLAIAVFVVLSAFSFGACALENSVEITVGEAQFDGNTVKLPVNITKNDGIIALRLKLDYDKSKLVLTDVKDAKLLGESYHTDTVSADDYFLFWMNATSEKAITATGTAATLTFVIPNDMSGEYNVGVSIVDKNSDCLDFDLKPVNVTVKNAFFKYEAEKNADDEKHGEQLYIDTDSENNAADEKTESNKKSENGISIWGYISICSSLLCLASVLLLLYWRKRK